MKNIFMIGMPGSGKSTLGRRVAEALHMDFLDTDAEITESEGMTPEEIIMIQGEEKLRAMEHALLLRLLEKENLFISTGGGFPVHHDNMTIMNERAITVYVKYSAEVLWERLEKDRVRPLSNSLPSLIQLLEERSEVYDKADIIVTGEEEANENLGNVIRAIQEYLRDGTHGAHGTPWNTMRR